MSVHGASACTPQDFPTLASTPVDIAITVHEAYTIRLFQQQTFPHPAQGPALPLTPDDCKWHSGAGSVGLALRSRYSSILRHKILLFLPDHFGTYNSPKQVPQRRGPSGTYKPSAIERLPYSKRLYTYAEHTSNERPLFPTEYSTPATELTKRTDACLFSIHSPLYHGVRSSYPAPQSLFSTTPPENNSILNLIPPICPTVLLRRILPGSNSVFYNAVYMAKYDHSHARKRKELGKHDNRCFKANPSCICTSSGEAHRRAIKLPLHGHRDASTKGCASSIT